MANSMNRCCCSFASAGASSACHLPFATGNGGEMNDDVVRGKWRDIACYRPNDKELEIKLHGRDG